MPFSLPWLPQRGWMKRPVEQKPSERRKRYSPGFFQWFWRTWCEMHVLCSCHITVHLSSSLEAALQDARAWPVLLWSSLCQQLASTYKDEEEDEEHGQWATELMYQPCYRSSTKVQQTHQARDKGGRFLFSMDTSCFFWVCISCWSSFALVYALRHSECFF